MRPCGPRWCFGGEECSLEESSESLSELLEELLEEEELMSMFILLLDAGVSRWVLEAASSWSRPRSMLESESEESESDARLDSEGDPELVE